jgi:hypothetical protein
MLKCGAHHYVRGNNEGKAALALKHHAVKTYRGVEVMLQAF